MATPHPVFASPTSLGLAVLVLDAFQTACRLLAVLAIVGIGFALYRRTRGLAQRAMVAAPIASCLLVSLWCAVFGIKPEYPWFVVNLLYVAGLGGILSYPLVWSGYVLLRPASRRSRIAAVVLLLAAGIPCVRIGSVMVDRVRAGLLGDAPAFRALLTTARRDSAAFAWTYRVMNTPDVREWIAGHPDAPSDVLRKLAIDDPDLRYQISKNPAAPPDMLVAFLRSTGRDATTTIAQINASENPSTPIAALTDSTVWASRFVRYRVARDPRLPTTTLDILLQRYPEVRSSLASERRFIDERAAPSTLRIMSTDTVLYTRINVAESPRAPADVLAALARDPSEYVRGAVARSRVAPADVLAQLATDTSAYVREIVEGRRAQR
jgi:hypothetical protein